MFRSDRFTEQILIFQRTHDIVVRDLQIAQDEGFSHGSKVVRGGYMDEVNTFFVHFLQGYVTV